MDNARWLSTLRWEIIVQFRQGFYYAAIFVVLVWIALLSQLPPAAVRLLVPVVLFMDVSVFGFYFMAGMLYLEMGDGVLHALVVTPLRKAEYLFAKIVALTLLAIVVSLGVALAVTLIADVSGVRWLLLLAGVMVNSWLLTLIGFTVAVRYDNISDFFLMSLIFLIPFQLPMLDYFGVWQHPLIYLIPTQPTMLLMEASMQPIPTAEMVYSFVYVAIALPIVSWQALRAYDRYVVPSSS